LNYNSVATDLLQKIGGKNNIITLTHCATRLRFSLVDNNKANKQQIQEMNGVLSVVESGGQFQVIIGNKVSHVYRELSLLLESSSDKQLTPDSGTTPEKNKKKNQSIISTVFDLVSGSLSPLIGVMAGSGILKAVIVLLTMANVLDEKSSTWAILTAISNAVFYFLPILLGVSAALKMGASAYIGGVIGASLMEPNFTALIGQDSASFLGIAIIPVSYASSVFPVLFAIYALTFVERFLRKYCPDTIQIFMVPMLSLLTIVPLTIMIFGPFGIYLGEGIVGFLNWLITINGILTGAVIGGSMMFLVMFGLHWALVPIVITNISLGGDPIAGMWAACTFAQIGVASALWLRCTDKGVKMIAGPAAISGFLAGITEPIVYGLILKFRRTIPVVVVSGAIGGALLGFSKVKMIGMGFHSLPSIPLFQPILPYVISITVAFSLAFILTTLIPGIKNSK